MNAQDRGREESKLKNFGAARRIHDHHAEQPVLSYDFKPVSCFLISAASR
jgi:hypothetical protein